MIYEVVSRGQRPSKLKMCKESYWSEEGAERYGSLYVVEEKHPRTAFNKYYHLHSRSPMSFVDVIELDIRCPECNRCGLKSVTKPYDYHDLGLLVCPECGRKKEND